jgi:histone H4
MARLSGTAQPAGLGKTATGLGGKGLGKSTAKRHRYGTTIIARWATLLMYNSKILRDNIHGITKGSIR